MTPPVLHVVVGVLMDDKGRLLIQRRAKGAHQGGLWEFPGGKRELGESVLEALQRELREELGIAIDTASAQPLIQVQHDYGGSGVLLDTWRIAAWSGEPIGVEGQPIAWMLPGELDQFEFPEANRSIISALRDYEQA